MGGEWNRSILTNNEKLANIVRKILYMMKFEESLSRQVKYYSQQTLALLYKHLHAGCATRVSNCQRLSKSHYNIIW